jgi:predicted nucleic acid-binding protein
LIVVDTSFFYALLDRRDGRHAQAVAWYEGVDDDLATSPLVLAETDYLASRFGPEMRDGFRRDLGLGAFSVLWWAGAIRTMLAVAERYADLGLSLADASLVALAGRLETTSIATFDERHFRALRPLAGVPAFRLLPADA